MPHGATWRLPGEHCEYTGAVGSRLCRKRGWGSSGMRLIACLNNFGGSWAGETIRSKKIRWSAAVGPAGTGTSKMGVETYLVTTRGPVNLQMSSQQHMKFWAY